MMLSGNAPRVAVFRSELLPRSETFIKSQVLALRRWQPTLVGNRMTMAELSLDQLNAQVSGAGRPLDRAHLYGCQLMGLSHRPTQRLLSNVNADLIHIHFGTDATDAWPSIRLLGKPVIITLHGYDININREWWEAGHGGLIRRQYPQRLLQLAAEPMVRFIAVSGAIRDRAIAYGIPASRITVKHIGVDCDVFRPGSASITQRARKILFVGRLVEKKGVEHLIRAFVEVLRKVTGATLVIAGDGPLRTQLQALTRSLSLPVEFVGPVSINQVQIQFQEARVLCLPSITASNGDAEGFGMVLLEAQACGVPVVSSATGGSEEGLLDNETGFRVPEADIAALAERLIQVLRDDALAERFSTRSVSFVRDMFDLRDCTNHLEYFYDSVQHHESLP